jgi:leucyl aminopeptidase
MNTTIRRGHSAGKGDHIAIFTTDPLKFDQSFFSSAELEFVNSEIKKKNKLIGVNQFSRYVFLQIVDSSNKERPRFLESIRKSGEQLVSGLNKLKVNSVSVVSRQDSEETLALVEGMILSNYQFLKYKSSPEKNSLSKINVVAKHVSEKELNQLITVCEAVYRARDLVNEPVITLNAIELAKNFQKLGKEAGFSVKVLDKKKLEALKMGGLLAVNMGSVDPPTFTVMEWKPAKHVNKKPVVLIGKGVVYDTGGMSLKPTPGSMDYMKSDMAGSAAVSCAMYAIAREKLPVHVIALVPATDNRVNGNAYTPGDVITMYSGLTVEVLNTDAEGRMILADALHYAKKYNPELVMEFSTLTGAAATAIGQYGIVSMGNVDDNTNRALKESGNQVYERLVEFPFWEEYDDLLKSDIADMKNIGGPVAGAITAGRFLQRFTDYPFMHFDIAGPSFSKSNDSYRGKNGTGVGVRFIFDYIRKRAGKK